MIYIFHTKKIGELAMLQEKKRKLKNLTDYNEAGVFGLYELKMLRAQLKRLFNGYNRMTSSMIKELDILGLHLIRKDSHFVFSYNINGKKLIFEIASTPSDYRSGLNNVCTICRRITKELCEDKDTSKGNL